MILTLARLLSLGLTIYMWLVIIRAVISWVNPSPSNPAVQLLGRVTDPPLMFIRRNLPVYFSGVDFSPIILILLIVFANEVFVATLADIGRGASMGLLVPRLLVNLVNLVRSVAFLYFIVMVARAVLSFISPDPYNVFVQVIYRLTEPAAAPLRRSLPLIYKGYDLAPLLALGLIYLGLLVLDQLRFIIIGAF